MNAPALLEVRDLGRRFDLPRSVPWSRPEPLQALSGVSFSLQAGRSLGIVGESGSGKSTLARLVMALDRPSQGQVLFRGQNLHALARPGCVSCAPISRWCSRTLMVRWTRARR